jgi:TonB family protein
MTETEIWTRWESQVVNGVFPLRRFLGRSNHSVVFLTECRAQNLASAAIKIIPADPGRAEGQLSRWQMIAELSHPHLIRVLEAGSCKLGGHPFLFVVTEYAEQNLAQILPHRALTADEMTEMLIPTLDALAFLHRQNLVHGQLKPPNFLVVNDQLKLSSDTIRTIGEAAFVAKPTVYDAPEAISGAASTAADVWSLGVSVIEALTQSPPGPGVQSDKILLPSTVSPAFADTFRRCMSLDPGNRPTVSALRNQIAPESPARQVPAPVSAPPASAPPVSAPPVSVPAAVLPQRTTAAAQQPTPMSKPRAPWRVPAAVCIVLIVAIWAGNRAMRGPDLKPAVSNQTSSRPASATDAAQTSAIAPSAASPVLHEEIPGMSRSARASIRGQIKVAVHVTVDHGGNVVAESLETRGSSRYFARLALEAAKKWKFVPWASDDQNPRDWSLQFGFSRGGVTAQAVPRARQ